MMESPLSCRNTEATPGVMPSPCRAKAAATRNTPNWAATPATLPKERSTWARHIRRRLASWAWALLWENSRKMSFSALKLFTTEKPARPSLTMERKLSFFRETSCSRPARRLPATREAPRGSRESTRAIKVSRGLYQSIIKKAPTQRMASITRSKSFSR